MAQVNDDVPVAPVDPLLTDPVELPPVKPGYLTTEFWTTLAALVGNVIVVLTVTGRLTPEQAKKLASSANELWTTIPILLANAWMLWHYVSTRTSVKQTAQKLEFQRMQFRQRMALTMQMQVAGIYPNYALEAVPPQPPKEVKPCQPTSSP